ncbi:MAG: Mur ligase family protein [Candidatus Limnocylindrales bacterium]
MSDLTYAGALAALQERGRFGIRLGLGRTRALLARLGDPHQDLRGVLIGGTNGKGSVQAMVAAVLRAGGARIGQTPKPHLQTYRERILVDGQPIAADDFADLVERVIEVADALPARLGPPTEFELLTAASFAWFRERKVQVGVIEVGLGGRLDATNVWDGGVAALTTVGLDHMEHLGSTLRAIGREKAAIIKRGDRAISGVTGEGALPIRGRARRMGVPLREVAPLAVEGMDRYGLLVRHPSFGALRVGLLGRHQAANAAVAVAVVEAMDAAGITTVSEAAIRDGLAAVRWPGRLELISGGGRPDVLLDGAHNAEGAAALAVALHDLRAILGPGRPTVVMAVLADKDSSAMVATLAASRALRHARIVVTAVPHSPRTLDAASLAWTWSLALPGVDVVVEPDADVALTRALAAARADGGPVIACGSLYLVGHLRASLVDDPDLTDS